MRLTLRCLSLFADPGRSVSVDSLRQVLSELAGQKAKFRPGHMDDAVEAFEEILSFLVEGESYLRAC